jgi:hypothetical protein
MYTTSYITALIDIITFSFSVLPTDVGGGGKLAL